MERITTLLVGLGLLTLSACSGDADPSPPPSPPPSPTLTATTNAPTPSPSPTPPAMPKAAKAHTKAGAKAFVEYFWDVVDYAQSSGDTAAIMPLVLPGCRACQTGIASIRKVYDTGGQMRGGEAKLSHVTATVQQVHGRLFANVEYLIDISTLSFDYPGASRDNEEAANSSQDRLRLTAAEASDWRVATFEGLQ